MWILAQLELNSSICLPFFSLEVRRLMEMDIRSMSRTCCLILSLIAWAFIRFIRNSFLMALFTAAAVEASFPNKRWVAFWIRLKSFWHRSTRSSSVSERLRRACECLLDSDDDVSIAALMSPSVCWRESIRAIMPLAVLVTAVLDAPRGSAKDSWAGKRMRRVFLLTRRSLYSVLFYCSPF